MKLTTNDDWATKMFEERSLINQSESTPNPIQQLGDTAASILIGCTESVINVFTLAQLDQVELLLAKGIEENCP